MRPSLSPGQRGPASEKAIRPRVTSSCQTRLQPTARCGGGLMDTWARGRRAAFPSVEVLQPVTAHLGLLWEYLPRGSCTPGK